MEGWWIITTQQMYSSHSVSMGRQKCQVCSKLKFAKWYLDTMSSSTRHYIDTHTNTQPAFNCTPVVAIMMDQLFPAASSVALRFPLIVLIKMLKWRCFARLALLIPLRMYQYPTRFEFQAFLILFPGFFFCCRRLLCRIFLYVIKKTRCLPCCSGDSWESEFKQSVSRFPLPQRQSLRQCLP